MDDSPKNSPSDAGLHEFVDAEFAVEGLESPAREKALRDALEKLAGLESITISGGKVMAHYEPVLLGRKQLEETIRGAGFQISEEHASASSQLTDAFAEKSKPPENG